MSLRGQNEVVVWIDISRYSFSAFRESMLLGKYWQELKGRQNHNDELEFPATSGLDGYATSHDNLPYVQFCVLSSWRDSEM